MTIHARLTRLLLAAGLVLGGFVADAALAGGALVQDVRAADTDLTVVTDARYDVQPAARRVRITVDATATNHKADSVTKKFYFDRAYLAVQPGTKGFAAISPSGARVSVAKRTKQYTLLRIDFGRRVYGGKHVALRFRFDLPDPGGAATRPIRVSDALAAFPIWAYASDGARGSTVSVTFPKGYDVAVERGSLPQVATTTDGRTVLRSGALAKPTTFFAYVVGDRPGAFTDSSVDANVDGVRAPLTIRAWVDDPAWGKRIAKLFRTGLPIMGTDIGRPWPWPEPLVVAEAASRTADADAGRFDPGLGRIEIAYYADSFVVLHEAAHAWFNGRLLADRWANEAFASFYAERAMTQLKVKAPVDALTEPLLEARIPLNAWGPTGSDRTIDDFGYAGSLELARRIAERAGLDGLAAVWRDAQTGALAYQPPAGGDERLEAETAARPPDWRGLLDLLEADTGKPFDDLWRTWVVRPEEAPLLDARIEARASYDRTLALAGDWAIPRAARDALRAWQFEAAETILADTRTVLAQREALAAAARRSGLQVPDTMRRLFEGEGTLADASQEAAREMAVIEAIDAAARMAPPGDDTVTNVGLLGAHPERSLAEARTAFEDGRLDDARAAAAAAGVGWDGAWAEGRRRLLAGLAILVSFLVLGAAVVSTIRRRPPAASRRASPSLG